MKNLIFGGFSIAVWFCFPAAALGQDQSSSIWDSHMINVCWENPATVSAEELDWIQSIIGSTWEGQTKLSFHGWEACTPNSQGLRILIDDQAPHVKALGSGLDGLANGMVLNFTYENWSPSCQADRRQYCTQSIATHQFGHAIGIAHSQDEPCADSPEVSASDIIVGNSDVYSVMNHCNTEWNGDILLGDADILAASQAYGFFHDSEFQETADICSVVASADDGNIAENTLDFDLDTRWSAKGDGQWIEFGLCDPANINEVDVGWYKGDTRFANFNVEASYEGSAWNTIYSGPSNGDTLDPEQYYISPVLSDKIRVVGFGNTSNTWNSITEVMTYFATPEPAAELNAPTNLFIDIESDTTLRVFWEDQSIGKDGHIIEVSKNASDFQKIAALDPYGNEFLHENLEPGTSYHYRIMSVKNGLTSEAAEISVTMPSVGPIANEIDIVSVSSSSDDGNIAENAIDRDFNTRWSAKGSGEWIEFDLGALYDVRTIEISWYKGDIRTASFSIQSKFDENSEWLSEGARESSGETTGFENFFEASTTARYFRILGRGNSANEWNSINDVRITGIVQ